MIAGMGTELASIQHWEDQLQTGTEESLLALFSPGELAYCRARRNGGESLAGRYALKCAVLKALGIRLEDCPEGLRAVTIRREGREAPSVVLLPPLDGVARALGVARIHSSISHSESLAVGLAVVEVLENKAVQVEIPVHVPDPAPASFPHQTQENGTASPTATEEH